MCRIIVFTFVYCVFAVTSLIMRTPSYATTNAWWAWPGQKFMVYTTDWFSCSVGFPASDPDGGHYFITAGHCFRSHDLYTHYVEDTVTGQGTYIYNPEEYNHPIGFEKTWTNINNNRTYLDISLVQLYDNERLYSVGWEHIPNNIVSKPAIRDRACLVGGNHNSVNCGIITEENVINKNNDLYYKWVDVNKATYCSHPGDAGGAVYNTVGALGINVSGDAARNEPGTPGVCDSSFVPIQHVLTVLQKTVPGLYLA